MKTEVLDGSVNFHAWCLRSGQVVIQRGEENRRPKMMPTPEGNKAKNIDVESGI